MLPAAGCVPASRPRGRAGLWYGLGAVMVARACAAVSGPPAVSDAFELRSAARAAREDRLDVIGLGDSNQLFGGHGWDHGWSAALESRVGLVATGLHSAGENAGQGAGVGWRMATVSTAGTGVFAFDAPEPFGSLLRSPAPPVAPLRVPGAASVSTAFNLGLQMTAEHPLAGGPVRFHAWYAHTGSGPAAVFTPAVRLGQPPWTTLVVGAPVPLAGEGLWGRTQIDLEPWSGGTALNFRWTPWGGALPGGFVGFYLRGESLVRRVGASFHTLYAFGGRSARDMALHLREMPDQTLALFFRAATHGQGASGATLVRVHTGLNDRNVTLPSLRAGLTPGNSPEAFIDNVGAVVDRVREGWAAAGLAPDRLAVVVTVSHPVSAPDDARLVAYREAADEFARSAPGVASVRLDVLTNESEMIDRGWYHAGGADRNHLTQDAFETLALRELDAILRGVCPADFSLDGGVDLVDFFGFFDAWDRQLAAGDLDGDGEVNLGDLFAFFASFDTGC